MEKYIKKVAIMGIMVLGPIMTFAQGTPGVNVVVNQGQTSTNICPAEITNLSALFALAVCILKKSVWPLLIALSVIVFIWGVLKYISGADDETKRTEGRNFMIYGIIGLFVMVSVWGLVQVLQGTFGFGNSPFIPQLEE